MVSKDELDYAQRILSPEELMLEIISNVDEAELFKFAVGAAFFLMNASLSPEEWDKEQLIAGAQRTIVHAPADVLDSALDLQEDMKAKMSSGEYDVEDN